MTKSFFLLLVTSFLSTHLMEAQCLSGNCYTGIGTYEYPSGALYTGHFVKGKIHGFGKLVFSDGREYEGEWQDHYRQGKGTMLFPKGDIYTGQFRKSKIHGYGTMEYHNGNVYVGQWATDFPNGQGKMSYNNGDEYEGQFKAGQLDGEGTMTYADGDQYVGEWKENKKNGPGSYYRTNGETIIGFWGMDRYIGEQEEIVTVQDVPESASAVEATTSLRNCNSQHCAAGKGKYTYSDGSIFIGEFQGGIPTGNGTCYYANGDKYEGDWGIAGPNGKGVFYFISGKVVGGIWANGALVQSMDEVNPIELPNGSTIDRNPKIKLWAVIIGVSNYKHLQPLKYTDDDAYRFYGFLKSPQGGSVPDEQIKVLVDDSATRDQIVSAMTEVFGKADENDVVIMYYSGHGIQGSFLPVNYNGYQNKLKHEEITAILNSSQAKHKIVLADACYSGTLLAHKSGGKDKILTGRFYNAFEDSEGGTAILLSSQSDEVSLEDQGLRQGVYTHFLIRGLKGEADFNKDKVVAIQELYTYVSKEVKRYTVGIQTPVIKGKYDINMPVGVVW